MIAISTIVAVMCCGLLFCLGYATSAAEEPKASPSVSKHAGLTVYRIKNDEGKHKVIQTIRGEVLRIEHESYFVKQDDGKEVELQIDEMTQMTGNIGQGEHIEANVNEQNHALSIRSAHAARD